MKVRVWAKTGVASSKVTDELEINDEELEGMTFEDREKLIEEYARDRVNEMLIDWGYETDEEEEHAES